jgi:hypothetical protein
LKHVIEELLIFKLLGISIVATATYCRAALNLHLVLDFLALRTSAAVNIIGIPGALFTWLASVFSALQATETLKNSQHGCRESTPSVQNAVEKHLSVKRTGNSSG